MFRATYALALLGALAVVAAAAPPAPSVLPGRVKDVRGTDGSLTLTVK